MPSGIKYPVSIDCSVKHVQFNQFIDGSIKIYTFPKSKVSIFSGYPLDRLLEPPLDPMYPDLKERDWPMSGRSRDRPPLLTGAERSTDDVCQAFFFIGLRICRPNMFVFENKDYFTFLSCRILT